MTCKSESQSSLYVPLRTSMTIRPLEDGVYSLGVEDTEQYTSILGSQRSRKLYSSFWSLGLKKVRTRYKKFTIVIKSKFCHTPGQGTPFYYFRVFV